MVILEGDDSFNGGCLHCVVDDSDRNLLLHSCIVGQLPTADSAHCSSSVRGAAPVCGGMPVVPAILQQYSVGL